MTSNIRGIVTVVAIITNYLNGATGCLLLLLIVDQNHYDQIGFVTFKICLCDLAVLSSAAAFTQRRVVFFLSFDYLTL